VANLSDSKKPHCHSLSPASYHLESRGCSEKLIVTGENTITAPDWKTFLGNEENKKQLIDLLCRVWSTDNVAPKLLGLFRKPSGVAILYGTGVRGYARSSFKQS
jgi:hypothetical protein